MGSLQLDGSKAAHTSVITEACLSSFKAADKYATTDDQKDTFGDRRNIWSFYFPTERPLIIPSYCWIVLLFVDLIQDLNGMLAQSPI